MPSPQASITDLARALGLSISTVSRALSGHPNIAETTRQRVQALAKELHYQPNHLAAGLRKGRSNLLGVLVPHIEGQFFASVVHGIETLAGRAGFHVLICQSNEDVQRERENLDTLLSAQVAGILVSVSRTTHHLAHFAPVHRRALPLVFFDRIPATSPDAGHLSAVLADDYQGAYQLTRHLLAQGARRIAHLAGPLHLNIGHDRHRGYLDALAAHGLPPDTALICPGDMSRQAGETAAEYLLGLPERPDAIFSSSDLGAVGALGILRRQGLRVPHDVLLAGFSNELFTSFLEPPLTSVDQGCEQMGQTAVRLLLDMLDHPPGKPFAPRRIVLAPEVLIRGSSVREV